MPFFFEKYTMKPFCVYNAECGPLTKLSGSADVKITKSNVDSPESTQQSSEDNPENLVELSSQDDKFSTRLNRNDGRSRVGHS